MGLSGGYPSKTATSFGFRFLSEIFCVRDDCLVCHRIIHALLFPPFSPFVYNIPTIVIKFLTKFTFLCVYMEELGKRKQYAA